MFIVSGFVAHRIAQIEKDKRKKKRIVEEEKTTNVHRIQNELMNKLDNRIPHKHSSYNKRAKMKNDEDKRASSNAFTHKM